MSDHVIVILIFSLIVIIIVGITTVCPAMGEEPMAPVDERIHPVMMLYQGLYSSAELGSNPVRVVVTNKTNGVATIAISDALGDVIGHWHWKVNVGDELFFRLPEGCYLQLLYCYAAVVEVL